MPIKSGKKVNFFVIAASFLIVSLVLLLSLMHSISAFLSKTKNVDANVLIVEGWLPQYAFEMTYNEYLSKDYERIITTGIKSRDLDFCQVAMNGYLIFYPKKIDTIGIDNNNHLIEVLAHSEMGGDYSSHFNLFVNDSLVTDFTADAKERRYGINWKGSLKDIDSIMFHFDNDAVDDYGDRNLYIKEVIIDNRIIIPYQFNSVYDIGLLDGKDRIANNYNSIAEIARNNLISFGIDSSVIVAVPGRRAWLNRTLTSALAFRDWLKISDMKVKGINIISLGVHARRTWMTYRKVLGKSYDIGIISLPESINVKDKKSKYQKIIIEAFELVYYWIILIPY